MRAPLHVKVRLWESMAADDESEDIEDLGAAQEMIDMIRKALDGLEHVVRDVQDHEASEVEGPPSSMTEVFVLETEEQHGSEKGQTMSADEFKAKHPDLVKRWDDCIGARSPFIGQGDFEPKRIEDYVFTTFKNGDVAADEKTRGRTLDGADWWYMDSDKEWG